jgi:hypothetical protein
MGKAIEQLCFGLDGVPSPAPRGVMIGHYDMGLIVDAVHEIRDLQAERNRLAFEVQILQMTQGALKMEIDRLREEAVIASDATVTVSRDGKITIAAPSIRIAGKVSA